MNNSLPVALITGGASGLGAAVVDALVGNYQVVVFDRQPVNKEGVRSLIVDVTNQQSVVQAFEQCRDMGELRVCVNCAGIAPAQKTFGSKGMHSLELFNSVVQVNLVGTFNVSACASDWMAQSTACDQGLRGVIINTASVAAFDGQMGQVAYAASKAGVAGMTLPMARDLGSLGIRVNTIAPGVFMTPMVAAMPDKVQQSLSDMVQSPKRLGTPDDFAALVMHIIDNSYLNAEVIRLDGGIRMQAR